MNPPTAKQLIATVLRERFQRSFTIPNYTPLEWWECDVFEVTKAGYFREYEVKLSKADFRADAKKLKERWSWRAGDGLSKTMGNKHELLASHDTRGPVQFWFVSTEGLIPKEEVPEWAGLIEVNFNERMGRWYEHEVKAAPRLHNQKVNDKITTHARGVCYYRLVNHVMKLAKVELERVCN